ncbi:MAG: DTW domain-containing protein [Xanthobacteraceae bacterium]|nr:DTW domain-containing protein [Xanthobacteraceae bacterium]
MNEPAASGPAAAPDDSPECPRCGKPLALCVCGEVAPVSSRIKLVILQHPQEQDRLLGTARLTALHFTDAVVKVGLSWPSLSKVLGRPVDPSRWAVLYLGSVKLPVGAGHGEVVAVDRQGAPEPDQRGILKSIEGVILLDGTWSQAKALWWRNAWLLKCQRVVLAPARASLYGKLRREPRREGLSTLEAAALLISHLEGRADARLALEGSFQALLAKYRVLATTAPEVVPPPKPRRDWRRRKHA